MNWKDRLMLNMMSNRVIIKIFSIPIVLKIMMGLTQVLVSVASRFKGKKEAAG